MKKSKIAALAVAGTLAVTAMLAGTYAWQNFDQFATNEVLDEANPGGRLHDDFNGTNKDVYVENFTSEANGGVSIYARIRLKEYLETGSGAGWEDDTINKARPLVDTAKINEKGTWTIFDLYNDSEFRDYVQWTMGGMTDSGKYMPTFNKNKDSLESDINGTLTGPDGDKYNTADAYKDYVDYAKVTTKTSVEIYDADSETDDEGLYALILAAVAEDTNNDKILDSLKDTVIDKAELTGVDINGDGVADETVSVTVTENTYTAEDGSETTVTVVELDLDADGKVDVRVEENQTHEVADMSYEATVITMAEWISKYKCQAGPYWVFDTDGWAYWAQEIKPGETTGCLLNGIEILPGMTSEYYYAIDVTAQFASAGDWGTKADADKQVEASGFYANGGMSDDALYLLNVIAAGDKKIVITSEGYNAETGVTPDTPVTFNASVKLGTMEVDDKIKWSIEGAESEDTAISDTGVLTVGEDEIADYIFVTASLEDNETIAKTYTVKVGSWYEVAIASASATDYVVPENIEEITLKAIVTDQRGNEVDSAITWSLTDDSDNTVTLAEQDDSMALLTITKETELDSIAVQATSNVGRDIVATDNVEILTQIEYLASISADETKWGLESTTIVIDEIKWYVLYRQNVDTDDADEVLLWATKGVTGWGGSAKTSGWKYYNSESAFVSADVQKEITEGVGLPSGRENWWKYSNARAWLNSEETGVIVDEVECAGFLADKDILEPYAQEVTITTRKEFNMSGEDSDFQDTDDRIFLLSQADVFGTTSGNTSGEQSDNGTTVAKDYTVQVNGSGKQLIASDAIKVIKSGASGEQCWLRSPRLDKGGAAYINLGGTASYCTVGDDNRALRPALWINLELNPSEDLN